MKTPFLLALCLAIAVAAGLLFLRAADPVAPKKPAKSAAETTPTANSQQATFAAGCFWCLEAVFEELPGVQVVIPGFAGGHTENPTYAEVSKEDTGHVETINITYDPDKISYEKLLTIYFKSFDPTDGTGVAPDFGDSYRPILFYRNDEQKATIEKVVAEVQKKYSKSIAVKVQPLEKFWPAEDYHQNYVRNHPNDPYVRGVSVPRVREALKGEK